MHLFMAYTLCFTIDACMFRRLLTPVHAVKAARQVRYILRLVPNFKLVAHSAQVLPQGTKVSWPSSIWNFLCMHATKPIPH
jgi:hypothetical protein